VVDTDAAGAGLPPLDSINLWDYISGKAASSPRTQVVLGTGNGEVGGIVWSNGTVIGAAAAAAAAAGTGTGSAGSDATGMTRTVIWKLLVEEQISQAGWTGPQSPNATFVTPGGSTCDPFCLYRLDEDPYEHDDLSKKDGRSASVTASIGHCSAPDVGVCLHGPKSSLLNTTYYTDAATCCANCVNDPRCMAWTADTKRDTRGMVCNTRSTHGLITNGSQCISGQVRKQVPTPAPAPAPPTPAPVPTPVPPAPTPLDPMLQGVVDLLKLKMQAAQKTAFAPDRGAEDPQSCITAMEKWGGYWGPWVA
jgi:hypothetical protein